MHATNLVLATHIPDSETNIFVFHSLHIKSCWTMKLDGEIKSRNHKTLKILQLWEIKDVFNSESMNIQKVNLKGAYQL